ncbi:MAG: Arf-GAP with coiled-coil, ANK repeat and PH domain-containing protein 2, variant 2 [Marteilia pararefringens]
MLIDNEGYLCLKKHDKLNYEWSKRSYYYIRGKKLVMSNKKMSNFVSIADDLSKTSVRYPDSFNSTLCFDLYFVKGFVKVKADTPAEAKNWVSNINNLALKYTKREEEKLRVVEGSHYADNNPDVKKCYRDMKKETDSIHKFESGGSILQMLKGDLRNVQTPDYLPKIKEEIYSVQSLIMNSTIGNMACADCKSHGDLGDVDWVSVNQGICICLACSGKHRSLTVRFSKVKS